MSECLGWTQSGAPPNSDQKQEEERPEAQDATSGSASGRQIPESQPAASDTSAARRLVSEPRFSLTELWLLQSRLQLSTSSFPGQKGRGSEFRSCTVWTRCNQSLEQSASGHVQNCALIPVRIAFTSAERPAPLPPSPHGWCQKRTKTP